MRKTRKLFVHEGLNVSKVILVQRSYRHAERHQAKLTLKSILEDSADDGFED